MSRLNGLIGLPGYSGVKTGKGTIPDAETASGNISHTNGTTVVTGSSTKFLSEIQVGQYIYIDSIPAMRKVMAVDSDTRLIIESTFGQAVSSSAYSKLRSGIYSYIRIKNTHATVAATVDGQSLPAQEELPYSNPTGGLAPIMYDGTGSSLLIQTIVVA